MLHKNRSKHNSLWKFAFVLPMLALFLMSFSTKEIYVAVESDIETKKDKAIEFVVTKDTTNDELDVMIDEVESKGGTLEFKNIKRNSKGEITNIFVSLYKHSYGGGNSKEPIESFIIYKKLFGDGEGFIGKPNGSTMFFDKKQKNLRKANRFSKKMKKHIEENNLLKDIKIIITKDFTGEDLEKAKGEVLKDNVTLTFSDIKRNEKGEIIAITAKFDSPKIGSGRYFVGGENPIQPFAFTSNKHKTGFGMVSNKTALHVETKENKHETHTKNNNAYSFVLRDAKVNYSTKNHDTIYFTSRKNFATIDTFEIKNRLKSKNSLFFQKNDKPFVIRGTQIIAHPSGSNNSIFYLDDKDKGKPLFILEDKIITEKEFKKFNQKNIASINVIKDKSAVKLYGEKGENGVVIITQKPKNLWSTNKIEKTVVYDSKGNKTPWEIRTEVTTTEYIDDDDASKNAFLSHLSKHTSKQILEQNKAGLESHGLAVKYSKIKRNKAGELVRIKISLSDEKGRKSSATFSDDDGIVNINYGISEGHLIISSNKF